MLSRGVVGIADSHSDLRIHFLKSPKRVAEFFEHHPHAGDNSNRCVGALVRGGEMIERRGDPGEQRAEYLIQRRAAGRGRDIPPGAGEQFRLIDPLQRFDVFPQRRPGQPESVGGAGVSDAFIDVAKRMDPVERSAIRSGSIRGAARDHRFHELGIPERSIKITQWNRFARCVSIYLR